MDITNVALIAYVEYIALGYAFIKRARVKRFMRMSQTIYAHESTDADMYAATLLACPWPI